MSQPPSPDSVASGTDVQMTSDEVAEFLQSRGDGVLTIHTDEPQSYPVSFGYDVDAGRCVFQLVSTPESAKRDLAAETPATFVAYEAPSPDDWTSVVVHGVLAQIPTPDADERHTYAEQATAVGMSVFSADPTDIDAAWYELRPTDATGRQSP